MSVSDSVAATLVMFPASLVRRRALKSARDMRVAHETARAAEAYKGAASAPPRTS